MGRSGTSTWSGTTARPDPRPSAASCSSSSIPKSRARRPGDKIFRGSSIGLVEGPGLIKKTGGTPSSPRGGYRVRPRRHGGRSRVLAGPYEVHPGNPLVSSRGHPDLVLQKAGHGRCYDAPTAVGSWPFLVGRPLPGRRDWSWAGRRFWPNSNGSTVGRC